MEIFFSIWAVVFIICYKWPEFGSLVLCVAVCDIFSVKKWCDLANRVRVRSRSLEMAPFDRSYTNSYSPSVATMAISCTVYEI